MSLLDFGVQAEGYIGPGKDKHGIGIEGGKRIISSYSIQAIIGIKIEVTSPKYV